MKEISGNLKAKTNRQISQRPEWPVIIVTIATGQADVTWVQALSPTITMAQPTRKHKENSQSFTRAQAVAICGQKKALQICCI